MNIKGSMTVKEFYDWCKSHGFEDAELRAKSDMFNDYPVSEWNIDAALRKEPNKPKRKVVIIGG